MSKPVELTHENFAREVLESDIPVVVDFWATWCGPCRTLAPVLEELAADWDGRVKIGKLNVDEHRSVAAEYGIRALPTLLVFSDGNVVGEKMGAHGKGVLSEWLEALTRAVDAA